MEGRCVHQDRGLLHCLVLEAMQTSDGLLFRVGEWGVVRLGCCGSVS